MPMMIKMETDASLVPTRPIRRSFTVPTRLRTPSPAQPITDGTSNATEEPRAETLFAHPHAKIVKFPAPPMGSGQKDGALPWTKPNERTEAVGVLRLYRLHGQSAAFLHSGNMLLSLMPRSQCWCVDGVSKFALRLQMMIYRIELPHDTDQDRACLEDFKNALSKVLMYEKTPCPFKRGFTVKVQEEHVTPMAVSKLTKTNTKARKWAYDEGWRPEGAEKPTPPERRSLPLRRRSGSGNSSTYENEGHLSNANSQETLYTHPTSASATETEPYVAGQVKRLESVRSMTAPSKYVFSPEDPFAEGISEDRSLQDDVAPGSSYVPLGSLVNTLDEQGSDSTMKTHSEDAKPRLQAGTAFASADAHGHSSTVHDFSMSTEEISAQASTPTEQSSGSHSPVNRNIKPPTHVEVGIDRQTSQGLPPPDSATSQHSYSTQGTSSPSSSLQSFQTARSNVHTSTINSPTVDSPTQIVFDSRTRESPSFPADHTTTTPSTDVFAKLEASIVSNGHSRGLISSHKRSTTPPPTPATADVTSPHTPQPSLSHHQPTKNPTPPTSPPSTVKPRPSQMLREFRSRRPSTPSRHSTATARGLNLDLGSAHYLHSDPLPMVPYGASNQGVVGATLGLLLGPPSGLVQVMMQIAARIARSTSGISFTQGGQGGLDEMGGAYYQQHKGRWVPGGWEDSDADESIEADITDEEFVEANESEEDDYGVPLGQSTAARRKRQRWGAGSLTKTAVTTNALD